jgi:NADPH-dependent 2,4-dienoyl-CoA reductase/sulfur reductase-like enzyme/rhodanese-related sulfurtransferase
MKTVIVGGVAGGMSAATRLRRLDEDAEIVILERGHYVSYANCGLPYYVGGVIDDRDSLLLQTPESLSARFRLDVRVGTEAIRIDPDAKTVFIRDLATGGESVESYDTLILAAGATAERAKAATFQPMRTLRTVDDVDAIDRILDDTGNPAAVVVIGGGFIGLEAVDNLVRRGSHVILLQRGGQVMSPLDPEMAAPLVGLLRSHGVDVRLNTTVSGSVNDRLVLSDGSTVHADLVIDAAGVSPDLHLADRAGLRVGSSGGIWVDQHLRTSDPSIYAVGDGVEKTDAIDGTGTLVTMAGLANRHGRAVADVIAGQPTDDVTPALGTGIVQVFDTTIAMVGWNEGRLVAEGIPHRVIHTHPASHATYFPGAETMAMKLLVDSGTDQILGAQVVGGAGVDKRIDIIAVAMAGHLTASQLANLELAYAPQFGAAKDPVNQIGYVADNLAAGTSQTIQWHDLDSALHAGATLVDVRDPGEYSSGHIPGAVNIPLNSLRNRVAEVPENVIVHCQVGQRGHTAARILQQHGRSVRNLDGGYKTWSAGMTAGHNRKGPE